MKDKLTTKQVARMASLTTSAVRYHVRNGNLNAETIPYPVSEGGEQYRYVPKEVEKFLGKEYGRLAQQHIQIEKQLETIRESLRKLRRHSSERETTTVQGTNRD